MINTALSSRCSGPTSRFLSSIHNGARLRHLARACLRHLARREVSVQVRARRLREHEVVRGVAGVRLLLDPIIFDMCSPDALSRAPGEHCNSHHARHTGQDTLVVLCLRCGSFLHHKSVGGFRRMTGWHSFHRIFGSAFLPTSGSRQASSSGNTATLSSLARHTISLACLSVCLIWQDTRILWILTVCSATRLHGPFVTVKTQASSRPVATVHVRSSEYRLCFVFLLLPAQHAHAVFARNSVRGSPNPQFLSKSSTKTDGSCSCSSDWRCTTARQAMCALVQDTSARSLFVIVCRRSETSTCGLCKATNVQRSGPGPRRRAHEAAQRQTQFLDHVFCLRNTITSRRHLPQFFTVF